LCDRALRAAGGALAALVCFIVCLASGSSPASASASHHGPSRQSACHRPSAPCAATKSKHNSDHTHAAARSKHHDDDKDRRQRGQGHKKANPHSAGCSQSKSPVAPKASRSPKAASAVPMPKIGRTLAGRSTGGGTQTVSLVPSATPDLTASTPASSSRTGSSAAHPVTPAVTVPAAAAARAAVALTSASVTPPPTLITAPTDGGQLPNAVRPGAAVRSRGAHAPASNPAPRSSVIAAPFNPSSTKAIFGIDSSMLLPGVLAVFALGVALTVASGHRRVRRTH
jgi:hypothetical protein